MYSRIPNFYCVPSINEIIWKIYFSLCLSSLWFMSYSSELSEQIALHKVCLVGLLGFFWTTDICLPLLIPYCLCPWMGKWEITGCGPGFQGCVSPWRGICSVVLPADIRDDAVREHFHDCGDVVGVRVVRDRSTGLGKGFGYVLFEVRGTPGGRVSLTGVHVSPWGMCEPLRYVLQGTRSSSEPALASALGAFLFFISVIFWSLCVCM